MQEERTGRSRALRRLLKAKRDERGWSLQRTADEIAKAIGRTQGLSGEAVRQWENFDAHPSIDKYAAWARVLGMQLIVDLVEADSSRAVAMLRLPTIEVARAFEMASQADQRMLLQMMERMGLMD